MNERKKRWPPILLVATLACGGVAVALCAASFAMQRAERLATLTPSIPTDTAVPSATPPPIPTDTAIPTETLTPVPLPTNTSPHSATPTAYPTATRPPPPTPSPTPARPALSPQAQQYLVDVREQIMALSDALGALGELTRNPRMGDNQWTISLAIQISAIHQIHYKLSTMNVPPELADVHAAILSATADCDHATEHLATGIDNLSVPDMETASTLITNCGEKMKIPLEMLQGRIP